MTKLAEPPSLNDSHLRYEISIIIFKWIRYEHRLRKYVRIQNVKCQTTEKKSWPLLVLMQIFSSVCLVNHIVRAMACVHRVASSFCFCQALFSLYINIYQNCRQNYNTDYNEHKYIHTNIYQIHRKSTVSLQRRKRRQNVK